MGIEQVREIANAVLYEGYLLYPYRPSAIKNRQRWNFGVVYPREYSVANGGTEPWVMRTECLIASQGPCTTLTVHIRFLHLLLRTDQQSIPVTDTRETSARRLAERLTSEPCEEGMEREIVLEDLVLSELAARPRLAEIRFPAQHLAEESVVREQRPVEGLIRLSAETLGDGLSKLVVQIENTTPATAFTTERHSEVLLQSFISTHTILQVEQGAFISLLEPPEHLQALAQSCQNQRTWPVLVGAEGATDTLLSSPIILYDYPQIAPESPGPLFDGTEIDELLVLRIKTLTDEEKAEIRQGDARGREMLDLVESLTPEQFMKMHGVIRSFKPVDEEAEV